jgi:secreted PhoX family phosphatase
MNPKLTFKKFNLLLLLILFSVQTQAQNVFEFKKQIATGTDDAEERQTGGQIDITSSDIELVNDGSTVGNQHVGLRFTQINIPKDATIVNAYIQFWVDENNHTGSTNLTIRGEANDNSATFSTAAFSVTSRNRTSASVAWNSLPIWSTLNEAGINQRTPDLKTILDEIRSRSGWQTGNAITIFINGTGRRNAHAYEGSTTMAPQLVIEYTLKAIPVTPFPIAKKSVWSYHDSGINLGTDWKNTNFIDSTWPFYLGKFGYGDGNQKTLLNFGSNPSNKQITTYFRKNFTIRDSSTIDSLLFRILVDDGAVVYLNGNEIFRRNMPSGSITYNTTANNSIYGTDEDNYFEHRIGTKLRNGINTLAVEVHQCDPESADKGFDMEVVAKKQDMKTTNFPIKKGDEWYFNDKGLELYGTNWTAENYPQETLWDYGKAPLGYGDPMSTTISFGPNSANKHVAYFFRKKIFIDDTANLTSDLYDFNIRRDDGAVVYVNGVEVLRQNMPTGPLNYRSISSSIIDGTNETTYFTTTLPKSVFKNGINQIAVVIHQRDSISSDLGFDMEIVKQLKPNPVAMGCQDGENHISCYTSLTPQAQTTRMIIPSSHNFQQVLRQGTAYTLNSGTIPGNHDFTAYVGRNGSSTDGVLAINHENSPGGVSLAYMRFIDSTQLWNVDSIRSVNFGVAGIVTTARNCSGGITPWGTVITSEESVSSADVNGDGYFDIGWNVEIDPWTGKIPTYGNTISQKLWGLGRMSHENVVIANDSVTVYQGEDGGTNLVYKFIADRKMDLSVGKLYVLRINAGITSGEPNGTSGKWIRVPNTTQSDRNNCNSLALAVGGTQFSGVEDVEISPLDGKIYFTAKGLNRTYRFKDADTTFSEFETFIGGKSYQINNGNSIISEAWGSGNDNLTFDDKGNLYVLQDGSRNHVWMVRPDHTQDEPKVELFMVSPTGSEPTGMTFTPDHKFMFYAIQHPSSTNVDQLDASGKQIRFNTAAIAIISRKENIGVGLPNIIINANKQTLRVGDSVRFKDLSFPLIQNRTWTFEGVNDSLSNLQNPVITYNKIGQFKVKLNVKNRTGNVEQEFEQYINVIPALPVVNFISDKTSIFEGDTVTYTDLSSGLIDLRTWKFNGGNIVSSNDSIVKVVYKQYGSYNASIDIQNSYDSIHLFKGNVIEVKRRKPIVNFTQTATTVFIGNDITLTDLTQNIIENRKWTINGSTFVTGTNSDSIITIKFISKGIYSVKLWASNAGGKDSLVKQAFIKVNPNLPIADFLSDRTIIEQNEFIRFTDVSTGEITSRLWKFTGGIPATSYDNNVNVAYSNKGTYPVELIVSNEGGSKTMLKTAYVTVNEKQSTSINNIENLADFTVYPNPVKNDLNITINIVNNETVNIDILDINGKLISTLYNNPSLNGSKELNLNIENLNLQAGNYIINIKIGERVVSKKIVKE